MEHKLRSEAKALLESGKVDCIVGYVPGSLKFTTTNLITSDKDDTTRLVINSFIATNLSVYLTEINGRVGIVAKGCDSRSIVSLVQDNKVARENIVILGVPCSGIINLAKVEKLVCRDRDEIDDISCDGDKVIVTLNGEKREFATSEVLADNCLGCELPIPSEYDILLDEPTSPTQDMDNVISHEKITRLKEMPRDQRWEFWKNEFERCIRCYACRSICPACFCQRCFVEETEPLWVLAVPRWQDNLLFQVVRNIHVAGRCTDCGACERACPMNIPLRSLTQEMCDIVDEQFHYRAGMDLEAEPLMAAYDAKDAEDFIR